MVGMSGVLLAAIGAFVFAIIAAFIYSMIALAARNKRDQAAARRIGEDQYDPIRRQIEARFKRRGQFALHMVFYLFFNFAFWFILPMSKMAAFWLSAAWALVLVSHGLKVLFDEAQERAIDREIARVQSQEMNAEKPKRHHLGLSEDGELVEIPEDMSEETAKEFLNKG